MLWPMAAERYTPRMWPNGLGLDRNRRHPVSLEGSSTAGRFILYTRQQLHVISKGTKTGTAAGVKRLASFRLIAAWGPGLLVMLAGTDTETSWLRP